MVFVYRSCFAALRERAATAIEPSWIAITSLLGRVATGKESCCVMVTTCCAECPKHGLFFKHLQCMNNS